MSESQKEFSAIFRLYNAVLGIQGLVMTVMMGLYAAMFGVLGAAMASTEKDASGSAGIVFAVIMGGIILLALVFTAIHFIIAWKFSQPLKWIRILAITILIFHMLNLYFLPLNIYFLVKLFDEEYKKYFSE